MVQVERRKVQRQRTLKAGSVAFNAATRISCLVRNLSAAGACLEVASPIGIPDAFVLLIPHDGLKMNCHVIWRSAGRIGVAFDAPSRNDSTDRSSSHRPA